jgi:ABC-type multidrug transport system ATPase subunit
LDVAALLALTNCWRRWESPTEWHRPPQGDAGRTVTARRHRTAPLAAEPNILILDESVAALDVSIQAQVLNLLNHLRRDLGTAYIFISHDLGVVRCATDRVIVMRGGQVLEAGTTAEVLDLPKARTPACSETRSRDQDGHRAQSLSGNRQTTRSEVPALRGWCDCPCNLPPPKTVRWVREEHVPSDAGPRTRGDGAALPRT